MEKRYNFRIYPNESQQTQIQKNFGCVRFIYNYYLAKRREHYESGLGILNYQEMCRDMTQLKRQSDYQWLRDADHNSLQRAIRQLDLAFQKFFRNIRKKGTAPGYPAFKSKKATRQSYTSPISHPRPYISKRTGEIRQPQPSIILYDNQIKLPKLGLVRCRTSRQVQGRILAATVIQTSSGKYYVSLAVTDWNPQPLPQTGQTAGLRMGVRNLITTSDGWELPNPGHYKNSAKKIARLQRELSRKTRGSHNFEKTRIRLAREYEYIHNQKTDMLQKLTIQLWREYDVICIRDESIGTLRRHGIFSKQLSYAGWGELIRLLSYKGIWYKKTLIKIPPSYPNARTCSVCGYEYIQISTENGIQEWSCPSCHSLHKRGINAAVNIHREGIRLARVM